LDEEPKEVAHWQLREKARKEKEREGGGKEDGPRTPAFSSVQHYVSRMSKTGWKAV
jgi:hypothetical protein